MLARLAAAFVAVVAVVLLPSSAWAADETPAPEPVESSASAPDVEGDVEPAPVEPDASVEPSPVAPSSPPVTVVVEPSSEPLPDAPGVGTGVYVDPATGSVRVGENTAVAVGVAAWLAAMVGGLLTARLVLP